MYNFSSNNSIHGIPDYINFGFSINFTLLFTLIPCFYMLPTVVVMWKVYRGYREMKASMMKHTLDEHIFVLLMTYFSVNVLFFVADFFRFNIPSTGRITSWCAKQQPGFQFTAISLIADFLNYFIIMLPLLISSIRMFIIIFFDREGVSRILMRNFVVPLLIIVPSFCVASIIPATGYCRQLGPPFSFGAIQIYYVDPLFKFRRAYFILGLSISCCVLSTIITIITFWKLRERLHPNVSNYTKKLTRKAEKSLTITLISAVVPFITNTTVSVAAIWFSDVFFYLMYLRQLGNDFETVMMPWTLYLTHPVFCEKRGAEKSRRIVEAWRVSDSTSRRLET